MSKKDECVDGMPRKTVMAMLKSPRTPERLKTAWREKLGHSSNPCRIERLSSKSNPSRKERGMIVKVRTYTRKMPMSRRR